jgi:acetate kinase
MEKLEQVADVAPLHVPVVLEEIEDARKIFKGVRMLAISDSRFHRTQPETQEYYAFSRKLADEFGVKRFGYHGISISAAVRKLQNEDKLLPRMVFCHLGSGASITAVKDGKSWGNSMGVTPLDGVMMATRVGSIDPSALLVLERALGLNNLDFEKYLNKECGLKGVAGHDDMRDVERMAREGDAEAIFGLDLYRQKVVEGVARAAAVLGGVDALVFTATIGERGTEMREGIIRGCEFLGFEVDEDKNALGLDGAQVANVGKGEKPVFIVKTNEATEIALQAGLM